MAGMWCAERVVGSRIRVTAIGLLTILTALGGLLIPMGSAATAAAGVEAPVAAREIRTISTRDLGLSRPQGVAFMPQDGSLLVLGDGTRGTEALRVTRGGDRVALTDVSDSPDPGTAAFDDTTDRVRWIREGKLIDLSGGGGTQVDVTGLDLVDPQSAAFDADTGDWFVLDAGTDTLVRATIQGAAARGADRISLSPLGATSPQGLALNPVNGRFYVGSPDQDRIYELDRAGTLRGTYDIAALGLADPQSMAFAPTTDTTDDPASQHLFIADAGESPSSGQIMEVSLEPPPPALLAAEIVTPQLKQVIDTSQFSPASPDPAGIVYLPEPDRLEITDSEVDETTGAGYHEVNLWELTRTGTVTDTGTTHTGGAGFSREPTGLGHDPATNTLFISSDHLLRVYVVRTGPDGRFGTADDAVSYIDADAYGSGDTEDPEFDPATGHLFFADGVNREVYRVDPVNGVFGDGDDVMTSFDVFQHGVLDPEALGSDPCRGTLLVGDRTSRKIYEITKTGDLVRVIDASGIPGMRFLSGLAWAPASDGSGQTNYWTVDRAVDNDSSPSENDGKIFELSVGSEAPCRPPVAVADGASTAEDTQVVIDVAGNDSDPDGNLDLGSVSITSPPAPGGTANGNVDGTVTYTPGAGFTGTDTFTYQICDTDDHCASAIVTVDVSEGALPTVLPRGGIVTEGDSGSTTLEVLVELSEESSQTVTVDWETVDTLAQPQVGVDYQAASGTVTFLPGETSATVPVTVHGDTLDEDTLWGAEWGAVLFHSPTNAVFGSGFLAQYGLALIADDDPPPVIKPIGGSVVEGDTGTTTMNVRIDLSVPSGRTVSVNWATVDTHAQPQAGVDYQPASGTLTFLPGETSKTVPVTVHGDLVDEPGQAYGAEWGSVKLSSPTNATFGTVANAMEAFALIFDDD